MSQEFEESIKKVFDQFDLDGSGAISLTELGDVMKKLGMNPSPEELREIIAQVDEDGNNEIEFNEFKTMMQAKLSGPAGQAGRIFQLFDVDRNGFITIGELKQALERLGERLTDDEIDEMIREADVDGDGKISLEEFKQVITV